MTKSVLHLSPYAVYPPTYGGPLRTHNICLHLSRHYVVDLFCQQVRRQDAGGRLFPKVQELSPGYVEFCSRNPVSLASYALFARLGCPTFVQSDILRLMAPAWLRHSVESASLINVEHPWQFAWVHSRVGGRKPVVLTAHNVEAELSESRSIRAPRPVADWLRRECVRREAHAMRYATRIFTMSQENSDLVVGRYGVDPARCVVVPNGVDCAKFVPVSPAQRRARKVALGLQGKFVVLFSGSSHGPNRKAVEHILDWARAWPDDNVCFLVAGSIGSAFEHVRCPRVIFSGPVDDMTPWLEAADIAVNPLVSGSGTTLKQVEYMAMGLASVATPSGARGIPVRDGWNVFIRSPEETPQQIQWLMSRARERDTMGQNARWFAERHFDWKVIAASVAAIYAQLLEERPAPDVAITVMAASRRC